MLDFMRRVRIYRMVRAVVVVVAALWRYWLTGFREKWPVLRATDASWERAHRRTGRAIYSLATGLRGVFVKLGQVIGARADAFPEALVAELRGLHDQVPPRSLDRLLPHLEEQLGRPVGEMFDSIEPDALAAASLAQVHRAVTSGGDDVVIKIQYPEAKKLFPVDFRSLKFGVRAVRLLNRKLDLRGMADELAEFVLLELDFEREATSTERLREAFGSDSRLRIPKVYRDLSAGQVITLQYLPGTPVSDVPTLRDSGVDLEALAQRIGGIYADMIFAHGFFQGDPHPGNLLVDDSGRVGVIDFGLAKELPDGFADNVAAMLVAAGSGDADAAIAAAQAGGFEMGGATPDQFMGLLKSMLGDYSASHNPIELLADAGLGRIPVHFTLIARVMVLLNGVSHTLAPGKRAAMLAMMARLMPLLGRARKSA